MLLESIKKLRRMTRNEDECRLFIQLRLRRMKEHSLQFWKEFVHRRFRIRKMFVVVSLRWKNDRTGRALNHWRRYCIQSTCSLMIQQQIRKFIAIQRRNLLQRMKGRVTTVQSNIRRLQQEFRFNRIQIRRKWAATTIQRLIRGFLARRRVQMRLEAYVDTQRRVLKRQHERWWENRRFRAAVRVQMAARKFLRIRKRMRKMEAEARLEEVEVDMKILEEQQRVDFEAYQHGLEEWFRQRKEEYDLHTLQEHHTAEQKAAIMAYRRRDQVDSDSMFYQLDRVSILSFVFCESFLEILIAFCLIHLLFFNCRNYSSSV